MTRIDKIKALCEAATKGPWSQSHRPDVGGYYTQVYCKNGETIATFSWYKKERDEKGSVGTYRESNAEFVAQSRTLVPELLELVEVMAGALENIAKSPDLPNPDRDADWKNCQKWSSHDAKEALAKYKVWNEGE